MYKKEVDPLKNEAFLKKSEKCVNRIMEKMELLKEVANKEGRQSLTQEEIEEMLKKLQAQLDYYKELFSRVYITKDIINKLDILCREKVRNGAKEYRIQFKKNANLGNLILKLKMLNITYEFLNDDILLMNNTDGAVVHINGDIYLPENS